MEAWPLFIYLLLAISSDIANHLVQFSAKRTDLQLNQLDWIAGFAPFHLFSAQWARVGDRSTAQHADWVPKQRQSASGSFLRRCGCVSFLGLLGDSVPRPSLTNIISWLYILYIRPSTYLASSTQWVVGLWVTLHILPLLPLVLGQFRTRPVHPVEGSTYQDTYPKDTPRYLVLLG